MNFVRASEDVSNYCVALIRAYWHGQGYDGLEIKTEPHLMAVSAEGMKNRTNFIIKSNMVNGFPPRNKWRKTQG